MNFVFKTTPGLGMCPVKGCRNKRGLKKSCCNKHASQFWRAKNPIRAAWSNLKHHAKQRRKEFTLTFEEFKHFVEQTSYVDLKGVEGPCLHVDRKEDTKGYTFDNIQVLTCSDNAAKEQRRRFVAYYQQEPELAFDSDNCPF